MDYATDHLAGGGQLPMPDSGLGTAASSMGHQFDPGDSSLFGVGTTGSESITSDSSLDEDEVAISRGTRVVTRDGHHVGAVHAIRASSDGQLEGLSVTSGHLHVHVQQHFVPAQEMTGASEEEIWLRLTAAQFADLEQANRPHGEQA